MDAATQTPELAQDVARHSMQRLVREFVDARLADCMKVMAEYPDQHFDLAIVDPPYGLSAEKMKMGDGYYGKGRKDRLSQGAGKLKTRILQNGQSEWDATPPGPEYFAELRRVSRNQIIWGGNYFPLPPTRCVVAWDKEQPWPNFSAWEMAWTSFDKPAKLFRWNNQGTGNPGKIHPTQKPLELYKWLLMTFAETGQRILDTHMGAGSIGIACHYARCPLVACEISPEYFRAGCDRIERETAQTDWYLPRPSSATRGGNAMMQENQSSQEARELPNPKGSQQRVARRQLTVASPERVPKEIAVCPECGGGLWWQVETTDGVRDLSLDCENEPDIDENEDMYHRWWQGEWQPVIDRVKRWVVAGLSPSAEAHRLPPGSNGGAQ